MYFYFSFLIVTLDCFLYGATMSACLENKYRRRFSFSAFALASFCCLCLKFSAYDNPALLTPFTLLTQLVLYLYAFFAFQNRLSQKIFLCILLICNSFLREAILSFFVRYILKFPISMLTVPSSYEFFISSAIIANFGTIFFLLIIFLWKSVTRERMPERFSYMPVLVPLLFTLLSLLFISYLSEQNKISSISLNIYIFFVILVNILLYSLTLHSQQKSQKEKAYQALCERYAMEKLQYKALEARSEELAKLRHDFNSQLAAINSLLCSKNYAAANEFATALKKELSRFS